MLMVSLPADCDEEGFRAAARQCLARNLPPEQIAFTDEQTGSLFDTLETNVPESGVQVHVPRRFLTLLSKVLCHRAPDRFSLLYRLLWRIRKGEHNVLNRIADADVQQAERYAKAVDKDVYRMHAYVRFSEREIDGARVFVAWHEPQHFILNRAASFFVDRFSNMDWLICTPIGTIAWRDQKLDFGPAEARPASAGDAVLDELWTAYYRTTFNPARLRVNAMTAQMPKRHWPTMPETAFIPEMVHQAQNRIKAMEERAPDARPRFADVLAERMRRAEPVVSHPDSFEAMRNEIHSCRECPLHGPATQAVSGEGPLDASVMFVGEQPGDQEDLSGRPFVGPAGQLFDRALAEIGIERKKTYVTNAVKHFKFEPRGKRRVHSKPSAGEVSACRFWLDREIRTVSPKLIVALGATAILGLTGRSMAVTKERGRILDLNGCSLLVTVHPSYLLRLPNPDAAEAEYQRFLQDLSLAKRWYEAA
ncbi:UdgX family uracil-DNA binding protein [Chelativorans sp. YIM 93263]|uniref:UdgX family uracil-DNA binding protein n=1 Tax=Chelativorans sp. YIM 93263 TaxID=2906648 RepID=UPI00237925F1|nr:UdgX family uracil-DNA binding protein [Chelativorans sp. YIM 93263]